MSIYNNTLKVIKSSEKRIAEITKEAIKQTQAEIFDLYSKYSTEGFVDMKELVKYYRLVKLDGKLKSIVNEMYKKNKKVIYNNAEYVLNDVYYKMLEEVSIKLAYSGIDIDQFSFTALSEKSIIEYIESPISGKTLSKIFADNNFQATAKLQRTVTNGIVRGLSIDKISDNIKNYFKGQDYEARRIARTETLRQMSNARLEALDQLDSNGVKIVKKWLTTLDGREREDHAEMNNVEADSEGLFYPGGLPATAPRLTGDESQDINCRCDIITDIELNGSKLKTYDKSDKEYQDWLVKNAKENYRNNIDNVKGVL